MGASAESHSQQTVNRHLKACLSELLEAGLSSPDAAVHTEGGWTILLTVFPASRNADSSLELSECERHCLILLAREERHLSGYRIWKELECRGDRIIEDQLKKRYIKDLLFILEELGVKCTDEAAGDCFIRLIELVLRRNVHVHNRGVVDERYLEQGQNARPKHNLDNLNLGDAARIDEQYWGLANRLTAECVMRVAVWASA